MAYTKIGPFTDYSGSPGLSAAFANGVENALAGDFSTLVTLPGGYSYDSASNTIERYGTLRVVHFALFNSTAITAGTKITIIPAGDRPAASIAFVGFAYNGGFIPAAFQIGTDGGLTYLAPGITGTVQGFRGTAVYAQAN